MALTIKDNTIYAVEIEDTEGTYKAPTAATSYVQTLADGAELTPAKELLERNIFNGSIGKTTPRTGTKSVSGALPVEFRAGETEGSVPEYDALLRSAMGTRKSTDGAITKTGNTASVLQIEDADISEFAVNDIVMVKEAGAYHVSPISAVDATGGAANITLAIPAAAAPADNVVVAAATTYSLADSGHPSLSISKYLESNYLEQATGCRVSSFALENFTTGQLASFNFGFEGLSFDQSVTASPFTPDFQDSLPPIILNACVFQDGVNVDVNELSFSMENTLGFVTATCSPNGRISSRITERSITGSFNPYKDDASTAQFDLFNNNTEYSLFAFAYNPTATAGEFENVVAVYLPKVVTTEMSEADQDNVLQHSLSFSAGRGADAATDELVVAVM